MIYGVDISNYQAGLDDFGALPRDALDFAFILCSDGRWRQPHFGRQLVGCRNAGLLTAAYHYQRANVSVQEQLDAIAAQAPLDCPVIIDVEEGSGVGATGVRILRELVQSLRNRGYKVPLVYVPRWYWSAPANHPTKPGLSSTDLSGLPPLWISWYPDYRTRSKEDGAKQLPTSVWNGYGGLSVAVAQFTSSGRVSGYGGAIDQNLYRGTRDDLAALLGGTTTGEDDFLMGLPQWKQDRIFERVLAMSAGVESENFNGRQFEHEEARHYALASKVDAMAAVLQQIAQEDDRVTLDDAQLTALQTSVREQVTAEVDQMQADLEARLDAMAEQLAATLGAEKAVVLEALREFYRPAVEPPPSAADMNEDGLRGGAAAPDGGGGPFPGDTVGDETKENA